MGTPWKDMTVEQKKAAAAAQKRYWSRNRVKLAAKKNKHYHKNRDHYLHVERARNYGKLYGITIADYNAMLAGQGGGCAICGSKTAGRKGQFFAVDHCHNTSIVRGLLCLSCNYRLGFYDWVRRHESQIATYLRPFVARRAIA